MFQIELKNITKDYGNLRILDSLNLNLEKGTTNAIIGKSGCGKSTLLHIAALLDNPSSGKVFIDGKEVVGMADSEIAMIRNKTFGFVFQENYLLEDFTALENVMVPSLIAGCSFSETMDKSLKLLQKFDLSDRKDHLPNQLSGGEKQRVAICRALINNPDIIFADEPTGSLDEENAHFVEQLLVNTAVKEKKTLLLVTHDNDFANMCDNVFLLTNHKLERVK